MSTAAETAVRMGEHATSATPGHVLLSVGLGSCIGLALLDPARGVAALAHVMLPVSPAGGAAQLGKYADTAVPALIAQAREAGARPTRLEAVLVGGAQMFSFGGSSLDVGARNAEAVTAALAAARVPVGASDTGGSAGRTIRVDVGAGTVRVRAVGSPETTLFSPRRAGR